MFNAHVVDCEFPLDVGATLDEGGKVIESSTYPWIDWNIIINEFLVWQWRYRFARDVLPRLTESLCSAKPIKYSEVMKLDRLVRDFDQHPFVAHNAGHNFGISTDGDFRILNPMWIAWEKLAGNFPSPSF